MVIDRRSNQIAQPYFKPATKVRSTLLELQLLRQRRTGVLILIEVAGQSGERRRTFAAGSGLHEARRLWRAISTSELGSEISVKDWLRCFWCETTLILFGMRGVGQTCAEL